MFRVVKSGSDPTGLRRLDGFHYFVISFGPIPTCWLCIWASWSVCDSWANGVSIFILFGPDLSPWVLSRKYWVVLGCAPRVGNWNVIFCFRIFSYELGVVLSNSVSQVYIRDFSHGTCIKNSRFIITLSCDTYRVYCCYYWTYRTILRCFTVSSRFC